MITLTWDQIMEAVFVLSKKLEGRSIYGIPRGGTLIATMLSYRGCKLTTEPPKTPIENIIIVDDIADSGETLKEWADKGFQTAALFFRGSCKHIPQFFSHIISAADYVKFPYESRNEALSMEKKGEYKTNG